jgi:hypothetical protein
MQDQPIVARAIRLPDLGLFDGVVWQTEERIMSRNYSLAVLSIALPLAVVCSTEVTEAQTDRPYTMGGQQAPMPDQPSFRDPKTGQVWTPDNVGQDGRPIDSSPADRAFNPNGQVVNPGPVIEQQARVERLGTVPITAGPTVPLVDIGHSALTVQPGGRWQVTMYFQNNSANVYSPVLGCHFFNGTKNVMNTRVLLPPTQGGDRLGISFQGPTSEIYVDRVGCEVQSP